MATTSGIAKAFITITTAFLLTGCEDARDKYIEFAQCLTDKGAKMYGAYWCPHCANQKELFGPKAFEKVTYIECDPRGAAAQPQLCAQNNITGYPTWIFADRSRLSGEQSLETLSERTICALPAELGENETAASSTQQ